MAEKVQIVAWRRSVSDHDVMGRWSVQHVARSGANYALCGARIRWLYAGPGDSRRCSRCFAVAARRGYVDDYGERVGRTDGD